MGFAVVVQEIDTIFVTIYEWIQNTKVGNDEKRNLKSNIYTTVFRVKQSNANRSTRKTWYK